MSAEPPRLIVVPFEQFQVSDDYLRRAKANARAACVECGAFVSNVWAEHCYRQHPAFSEDPYEGPTCEPGKGCNRPATEKSPA